MKKITQIIAAYTAGEATLEETNAALKEAGATVHLNPDKNTIAPDEVGRFGLLDTGTGTYDKVEVVDGKLVNCDCGEMLAYVILGGATYKVQGKTLQD